MPSLDHIEIYVLPLILMALCIGVGILLELFFKFRLKAILAQNNWVSGSNVLKAFRGITFIIFLGIGIYLFVDNLPLETSVEKYLTKSVNLALILSTTILLARIAVAYLTSDHDHDRNEFQGTSIITNISRIGVYCIGGVVMLQTLDISITPVLTALGVGGLAVALALQDTLSNLFAGIFVIASKKIGVGDYIKLQSGEEGFVEDISWRTITIKETTDTMVVVPNSKLSTAIFKNFNLPSRELIFPVQLMVSFDNDMHLVEKVSIETALKLIERAPQCIKTHLPVVRFHTFTDAGLQFAVIFRIREATDQGPVRHEFIKEVMKAYRENGIEVSEKAITLRNKTGDTSVNRLLEE
jgi:small-conductance mechanosensitive channel